MGRKWTILNRYISVNTDFDEKRYVLFEHTINRLSFGYVCLPQPKYFFFSFVTFFSFPAIYFSTGKRTVFKVRAIEDIRED